MTVATIVTADRERAERAAGEYPSAVVEATADAVWERAAEHDFVVIATPNDAHVPLATRAIDAGLAVVVDKPLAPSSAAARELVERARSAGVPLTVFHNRRWDSDFLTLRRLIAGGELGEIFDSSRGSSAGDRSSRAAAWRESVSRPGGGGLLLDLGTHLVDQALELFGPAAEVQGRGRSPPRRPGRRRRLRRHPPRVRRAQPSLGLIGGGGAEARACRVLGSRGAFVVEELDGQEDALRAGRRPGEGRWGAEPEGRWGRLVRGDEETPVPSADGAWPEFYVRLESALSGGGDLPVDPGDAVAVLEVLEAAEEGGDPWPRPPSQVPAFWGRWAPWVNENTTIENAESIGDLIADGGIRAVYQPIIDLEAGRRSPTRRSPAALRDPTSSFPPGSSPRRSRATCSPSSTAPRGAPRSGAPSMPACPPRRPSSSTSSPRASIPPGRCSSRTRTRFAGAGCA